jgi:hypothetical protein
MARAESKMIMGYLPIEERHYPALLSLIHPATPAVRLLDPFAGEGAFLEAAAKAWNLTPYANELDGERAAACIARFDPTHAVRCDVERLAASSGAFGVAWLNPPYDHDAGASGSKRVEFRYLRHAWKWVQTGGVVLWCVYRHHLTEEACAFFAKHSTSVTVWGLPGKHLGQYDQIVVAAVKGEPADPSTSYDLLLHERQDPRPLTVQPEPVYKLPSPPTVNRFTFAPDVLDEAAGLRLVEAQGAWRSAGFQALLEEPALSRPIVPVVAPRPGHLALVLAAGVADGAVIDSREHGRVALRGKTRSVEQVARIEVEQDPHAPERDITKTTVRLKPATTLTLLAQDGRVVEMSGDEALLGFISANKHALAHYLSTKFQPLYRFDLNGLGRWLDGIRLNGKHALYTAQKHVIAAVTRGLQERDHLLLIGQMGVGKTALGGASAIAIASHIATAFKAQVRPDQVVLIVAPPHLIGKWKREVCSIAPKALVAQLDRHEDVKAFMAKALTAPAQVPKIGLIKRDLTKLGCPWEPAVVWRKRARALWRHDQTPPHGLTPVQRLKHERVPICPTCGCTVSHDKKGVSEPASAAWLSAGRRTCSTCHTPLWRESRDRAAQPKVGEKYPPKPPRYRLDVTLKRHYPDRVALLIWDEVHEAQHGDTGNGEAFSRMAGVARKVLAMTGTPFNGRASSIFNLEYALNPRVRQRYGWGGAPRLSAKGRGGHAFQTMSGDERAQRGRAEARWVADMGVREQITEERPTYDRDTGAYTGTSTYQRPYQEAPGISPLLVAEVLDHAVFFSLGDLGKALPQYEEIALPVDLDADVAAQYERTRQQLKDYMVQRRWMGDATFRGAYLQWAMGWVNTPFRPYEIVHNLSHRMSGEKEAYVVARLPSFGEERVYAKERALIELVREELAAGRPCVVYLRQTATRDIQPRLERLLRQHVPEARPFILKNTVEAERREKVIEQQIAQGTNVVLCNPELVKTGLDLIHFPTLIFYELVYNLATLMQAAARSYRLNQTHTHCKVLYLYAAGTMEQTAVQLMSRKQRAAKLLTGDLGLTGLDALTEGEGGLEEALLAAIGHDDSLLDPAELFKRADVVSAIDAEDAAYWQVQEPGGDEESLAPVYTDPVLREAVALGATITLEADGAPPAPTTLSDYLDSVSVVQGKRWDRLKRALIEQIERGMGEVALGAWLMAERVVFPGCEGEVASKVMGWAGGAGTRQPAPPAPVKPRPAADALQLALW